MENFYISNNEKKEIFNQEIVDLSVLKKGIESLTISNLPELKELNLSGNNLKSINLICENLEILNLSSNQIKSFNFELQNLKFLDLSGNELKSIKLNYPKLKDLHLSFNKIDSIEIIDLSKVIYLDLKYNYLKEIILSLPNLEHLDIDSNDLEVLKLNCPKLKELDFLFENKIDYQETYKKLKKTNPDLRFTPEDYNPFFKFLKF